MVSRLVLNEDSERDFIRKGSALIRRQLNTDPTSLSDEQWARMYTEAKWLHDYEIEKLSNITSRKIGEVVLRAMGYKFESD